MILGSALFIIGCTENQRARKFGGTMTLDIEKGRKVITVSFKEADLWVLTREARADEKPEELHLTEKSNFGLMEGKIILKEH